MSKKPFLVACIPAFNEENTIAKVILKTQKYVDKVIVCDDGSTDMTGEIAERLGAEVIRHERNRGYGAAIQTLVKRARELDADVLIILDGDAQHNPDQTPQVIKPIFEDKADIVIGSRFHDEGGETPKYRASGIKVISKLVERITGLNVNDAQCGFRAYSKKAFTTITPTEQGMGVSTEILSKAADLGLKVVTAPVTVRYEGLETSTHNPLYHGLDVIASTIKHYSIRHPLLFYGLPGALALLVATFFWAWTLQTFTVERQVSTNIALVAFGSTIVGLTLLTTAIILFVIISVIRERE